MCTLFLNISAQLDDITLKKEVGSSKVCLTSFVVAGGDLCDFVLWYKQ